MKRFGVSIEDQILEELDTFVKKHNFSNRSQAIRILIRKHTKEEQWKTNQEVSGCVVLVYDHHRRNMLNKLVKIQHSYEHSVLSTQHVHLDHDNCLETIIVKGKAKQIRELADQLIAIKGVKHGQLVMSSLG